MSKPLSPRRLHALAAALSTALALPLRAQGPGDLTMLSLEQLMALEVTTPSRAPERSFQTPAAIAIVTGEQIRRAGVTSLPEALRLVPGIHVARLGSDQWSVGLRGFGSRLSRSLLVMVDGRSVYTPLFAGTYWEVQDLPLADVDRIEVVRGPGGALWGANAVNGVINIITKAAKDTQGTLVSFGGGTEERGFGTVRYGGRRGAAHYRVYGKYFDRDASAARAGGEFDDWRSGRAGFRADWEPAAGHGLTVQGDAYRTRAGTRVDKTLYTPPYQETVERDARLGGGNVLARWSHAADSGSNLALRVYYDREDREESHFEESRDTGDLDFQRFLALGRHGLTYGAGYRWTSGEAKGIPTLTVHPARRTDELWNGFIQDQIELVPDRISFALGVKAEHNDYTGWEVQPSGRLLYTPSAQQTLWTSVTRAVRTPSRVERDIDATLLLDPATPTFLRLLASPDFGSERVIAYETGYRLAHLEKAVGGLSLFYNDYQSYSSFTLGAPFSEGGNTIVPVLTENDIEGRAYGGELIAIVKPAAWWRLRAVYSFVRINLETPPGTGDVFTEPLAEGGTPRHQFGLQSPLDVTPQWELDPWVRYVGGLPAQSVPAYWTMDLRLGWRGVKNWELALVGQNLLQKKHPEGGGAAEMQRGVYVKATWRVP